MEDFDMCTLTFIRQNYKFTLARYNELLVEQPLNRGKGLRSSEGQINPQNFSKAVYAALEYFAFPVTEFIQPNYSDELTVQELLAKSAEHSILWSFYTLEGGLIKKYYRRDNRDSVFSVTTVYPWQIHNRKTIRMFRRLSKHGSFVLGVNRLAYKDIF